MVQSQLVGMISLGVRGDAPPVDIQPPLADGIHLRWGATRESGFPWYGYYLYRRPVRETKQVCLQPELTRRTPVDLGDLLRLSAGTLSSDLPLRLSEDFPPPDAVEVDLSGGRAWLRFAMPTVGVAYEVSLLIGFRPSDAGIEQRLLVRAENRGVPVAEQLVTGNPGDAVSVRLNADAIDAVVFLPAGSDVLPIAGVVELCYLAGPSETGGGWKPVPDCPQPITLPVRHPDYPASGNAAVDEPTAQAEALERISYGDVNAYAGAPFADLHEHLIRLVVGGPGGPPMADPSRSSDLPGVQTVPGGNAAQPPVMSEAHPLDLVLLASRHPAAAQMLGLYWVDGTAQPGMKYDYLVVAKTVAGPPDPQTVLASWQAGAGGYEGFLVPGKELAPAPPLAPPDDPRAYALPAGAVNAPGGPDQPTLDAAGLVGLRWALPMANGTLLPYSAVAYHLWREALGDADQPRPSTALGDWLTKSGPVLVARPNYSPSTTPAYPAEWPSFSLYRIDRVANEGWYGYRASGMDLFGRISPPSPPAPWHQWAPPPVPRPWYYLDPPGDAVVHPSSIRILDKTPPPPPPGVEASVLDPRDPYVLQDAVYMLWRQSLPAELRDHVVGLRVHWRWTATQMRQAPDAHEFRLYFNPGTTLPAPDARVATSWAERIHVTAYADATTVAPDGSERVYEVFLPTAGGTVFAGGVPLTPTLADPVVYAHVGVSAADGAPHTPDAPQWAGSPWGNRQGNEGILGAPAKVFRVKREPPAPPPVPPDSERVYASPADYSARSFYTYRWAPRPYLRTHVFRAMDTSVFAADRALRPRPDLTGAESGVFPDLAVEPRWDTTKRAQVAAELNGLNAFARTPQGDAQATAAYGRLSNDGLRVLAGLAGTEPAFSQLTVVPLDPADPVTTNRPGPDNSPDFPIDPHLCIYVDTLDGRSTNRYFYRAAYVDGAHNRSALSLSGPPVWLPNVVPPRAPSLTSVTGGERQITLTWASNREPDLVAYRVYRADTKADARDVRAMTLVHTEPVAAGDPTDRPAAVTWADDPVPGLVNRWYAVVAVDEAGNASTPSRVAMGRAHDEALPIPPTPTVAWVDQGGTRRAEITWTSTDEVMVQRREGGGSWLDVASWRPPGTVTVRDPFSVPDRSYDYRLRVRKVTGALALGEPVRLSAAP